MSSAAAKCNSLFFGLPMFYASFGAMVDIDPLTDEDIAWLRDRIEQHRVATGSTVADRLLADWDTTITKFKKVMPADYRHNYYDDRHIAVSDVMTSVRVIEPTDCSDLVYFLPTPKSPHGVDVDPTGEYIVAGGKLATVIPVHSFSKMITAIEAEDFEDEMPKRNGVRLM